MADAQAEAIELIGSIGGPGDTQILSAIKNGPAGIKVINTALHHLRATGKDTWEGFAVDDPVIYLENDYDRRIWNGTLGVVQAAGPTTLSVLWDGHDRSITMDRGGSGEHGSGLRHLGAQGSPRRTRSPNQSWSTSKKLTPNGRFGKVRG
jgi:exodeoxyribonuclease V alpha subunit